MILELEGFWLEKCWPDVADDGPALRQHWDNVSCYLGSGISGDLGGKRHRHVVRANTGRSPNVVSMFGQRRRLWVNIETALNECHMFADVLA